MKHAARLAVPVALLLLAAVLAILLRYDARQCSAYGCVVLDRWTGDVEVRLAPDPEPDARRLDLLPH